MSNVKYLNDKIFVDIPAMTAGQYKEFKIYVNGSTVYEGRLYTTGKTQRIYLNDLAQTYSGNYTYMFPSEPQVANNLIKMQLSIVNGYTSNTLYILNMYKPSLQNPVTEYSPSGGVYNVLKFNTDLLPRIPNLSNKSSTDFFFAFQSVKGSSGGNRTIKFNTGGTLGTESFHNNSSSVVAGPSTMLTMTSGTSYIKAGSEKIADVDSVRCTAEFYLIWVDRSGAYQCQPFSKHNYHKENLSQKELINPIGEKRPYQKLIDNKWTLNSDWIAFKDQRTYESILTSPYLFLYNSVTGRGTYVNCVTADWIDYSRFNRNKPFQYTIDVIENRQENLLY